MCNPKQHKMWMNFSYNKKFNFCNFDLEIRTKIQKSMMWHSINVDSVTFHHMWVMKMGAYWHKCRYVKKLMKINSMHTNLFMHVKKLFLQVETLHIYRSPFQIFNARTTPQFDTICKRYEFLMKVSINSKMKFEINKFYFCLIIQLEMFQKNCKTPFLWWRTHVQLLTWMEKDRWKIESQQQGGCSSTPPPPKPTYCW